MKPWNPYAMTFHGQPITGQTPPKLVVYGPPLTAQQGAMLQTAYNAFVGAARVSIVPNPTRQGRLLDGSPYTIECSGASCTCTVWTTARDDVAEQPPGGAVVFYQDVGFFRVWWDVARWKYEHVKTAYCGVNVQRSPGGGYFCDNASTNGLEGEQPTKLSGLERSEPYDTSDGVSARRAGYFFKCGLTGDMNYAVQVAPGTFTYLTITAGSFKILSGTKKKPSPEPTEMTKVVSEGSIDLSGLDPITQYLARRCDGNFLLVTTTEADYNDETPGIQEDMRKWLYKSVEPAVRGPLRPREGMRAWVINSSAPYTVTEEGAEVIRTSDHSARFFARRIPTKVNEFGYYSFKGVLTTQGLNELYDDLVNFPIEWEIKTHLRLRVENEYERKITYSGEESRWLKECGDFLGGRYSMLMKSEVSTENSAGGLNKNNNYTAPMGFPRGSWQLWGLSMPPDSGFETGAYPTTETYARNSEVGGDPEWDIERKDIWVNKLKAKVTVDVGDFVIPLTDANISITEERGYKTKNYVTTQTPYKIIISGGIVLRVLQAFEEKNYVSVVSEVDYYDFEITYSASNGGGYGQLYAKKRHRLAIYHKSNRVFEGSWGATESFQCEWLRDVVPYAQIPSDIIRMESRTPEGTYAGWQRLKRAEFASNGDLISKGVVTGVLQNVILPETVSIQSIIGGEREHDPPTSAQGTLEREFLRDELDGIENIPVRFAVDPTSGGCAVITGELNVLVSSEGRAEKISDVTGIDDEKLDLWGASI